MNIERIDWSFEEDENGNEYLKITAPDAYKIRQAILKELRTEIEVLRPNPKKDADMSTFDLQKFLGEVVRITSGSGYIFCGWSQISEIIDFLKNNKISTRLCCWRKTNPSPMNGQSIWLSGAEYCVYFKKPNATFNEHCKNCVWDFPSGKGKQHPTEKPLNLFKYLIEVSSNVGDTVFDPCLGGGTTAVAAIETGRDYIGVEMKKEYYEIAKKRVEIAFNNKEEK